MLGPLPPLHRWVVLAISLVGFVALGLWVSLVVPTLPTLGLAGAGFGAAVGLVAAYLLLHQSHPARGRTRHPL